MNTQQIDSFLALCETLNFSKAAQLIHISQSVVSRHIAQMEEELGFPLFNRTKHSVALTDSGEIMRSFYAKAQDDLRVSLAHAARLAEPSLINISIHLLDLFDNKIILHAISTFPRTTFHIERFTYPCHTDDLLSGYYDVGVGYEDELNPVSDVRYRELLKSRDNLICARNYSPPKRGTPTLFMVSDDMRRPANISGDRPELLNLSDYKIRLVPNIASALAAVESGMGYTLLKDFSFPFVRFDYRKIMLNAWQSIGLAWVDDPKRPHIAKFVEHCFRELDGGCA